MFSVSSNICLNCHLTYRIKINQVLRILYVKIFIIIFLSFSDWSLFMCQSFSENECQLNDVYSKLRPDQRVNRIPGLRSVLGVSSSLCNIQSRLSALGFHQKAEPFCFTLPEQYEDLLNAADGPGLNSSWFIKSSQPGVRPEMLTTSDLFARARLKK